MNTDKILKDFDFLVQNGVIGCYNSCEVTEIFAYQNSEVYNIYTLVCLEYSSKPLDNEPEYLSERSNKWKINKNNWKVGIRRVRISIAKGREILKKLSEESKLSIVPNEESKLGNLEMQGKAYVPSETEQALNNIFEK